MTRPLPSRLELKVLQFLANWHVMSLEEILEVLDADPIMPAREPDAREFAIPDPSADSASAYHAVIGDPSRGDVRLPSQHTSLASWSLFNCQSPSSPAPVSCPIQANRVSVSVEST